MEFPGDPASLSNGTIPGPSLALPRRETVPWFTFSLGDLAEGCFVSRKAQCSALVTSASHHSLSASPQKHSLELNQQLQDSNQPPLTGTYGTLSRCPGRSQFPMLSPQYRGFLLDGQRQSSKLSLIADRHDKSQVVRSIAAVHQRKDATRTELAVFFRFFSCLSGDISMTNSLQK